MTKQLSPFAVAYRLKSPEAAERYAAHSGLDTRTAANLLRIDAEQIEAAVQDAAYYEGLSRMAGAGRDDVRTLKTLQAQAAHEVQTALARLREWGLA